MLNTVKRRVVLLTTIAMALAVGLGVAWAANPHFIFAKASLDKENNLVIAFKEAGLGSNQLIHYVASADSTATYQCVNHGGKCPQAANKTTVSGPVSGEATFSSGKNGQITQSLTVSPPPLPADFSCPNGQVLEVAAVTYSNITLTDTTNGIPADVTPTSLSASANVCP
jgi:hypothetical protein